MSSLRRHGSGDGGLADAALAAPGVLCELIADGVHVPDGLLREAYQAKGWRGIVLVSDATAGAGLPEGASFTLGGLTCRLAGGSAWTGEGGQRRLAGSAKALFEGVRTMAVRVRVPIEEAVAMATIVPALSLGLHGRIGSIVPGKQADLIRFSPDWALRGVWIAGEKIAEA
jgi:N-acetylglucosamine-6-phosphate deacetylase